MSTFTYTIFRRGDKKVLFQVPLVFSESSVTVKTKNNGMELFTTLGELFCYLDAKWTLHNIKTRTLTESGLLTKDYDTFVTYKITMPLDDFASFDVDCDHGAPVRHEALNLSIIGSRADYRSGSMRAPSHHTIACRTFEEFYAAMVAYTTE